MTLARVTGTVVCTVKVEALEGLKLMIVHPINPTGELIGKQMVAAIVDRVDLVNEEKNVR
jgi:microcompartment protein CcmK/EutM